MNLRKLRSEKGMTQKQLAQKVGVTDVTITHYEKGHRDPKPKMLRKLATALECTVDELIGDCDDSKD